MSVKNNDMKRFSETIRPKFTFFFFEKSLMHSQWSHMLLEALTHNSQVPVTWIFASWRPNSVSTDCSVLYCYTIVSARKIRPIIYKS